MLRGWDFPIMFYEEDNKIPMKLAPQLLRLSGKHRNILDFFAF